MAGEIKIYAELLQNLRQVTVAIALPSPTNGSTIVNIDEDGLAVSISHDGLSARLRLPAIVNISAYPEGALPVLPVTCSLSWRFPISSSQKQRRPESQTAVPWPATDLRPGSEVRCRECAGVVVSAWRIAQWKDLPSENWAEMMEFWHCHKPGDGHGHGNGENHSHSHQQGGDGRADETTLASRGYGANSIISSQEGVGLVDLTSLWFAEKDCEGILFSIASADRSTSRADVMYEEMDGVCQAIHISCAGCEAKLGYFNDRTSAVTLFKWKVSCATNEPPISAFVSFSPPRQPTAVECLAATLLATTARTGSSKALLVPTLESSEKGPPPRRPARILHLWTLNSAIHYVSTLLPDEEAPIPASKLFFETIDRRAADRMLERVATDVEEVAFPEDAIAEVAVALRASNELLPYNEKAFREWEVGLLRRWEVE